MVENKNWSIRVIGQLLVLRPDGTAFRTRSEKQKLLLSALSFAPQHTLSRAWLAQHLFDESQESCQRCMRVLLHRLQVALNSNPSIPLLRVTSDSVSFIESNVEIDLDRLQIALDCNGVGDEPIRAIHIIADVLSQIELDPISYLEHPLVLDSKQLALETVFDAMLRLAQSPISVHYRSVLLNSARCLLPNSLGRVSSLECLLKTLSTLGEKEMMIKAFMSYEQHLSDETGELPSAEIIGLLDQLLGELDQIREPKPDRWHPSRPDLTIGREREITEVLRQIEALSEGGIYVLAGLSGVGKSHLIKEVYFQLDLLKHSLYIDLDQLTNELSARMVAKYEPRYLFLDHFMREHQEFLTGIRASNPRTRIICVGLGRLQIPGSRSFLLGPIPIETEDGSLGAIDLLYEIAGSASNSVRPFDLGREAYANIARLCDGIPLALTIAGRLCSTVGPHSVLGAMRRSMATIESQSGNLSRSSSVGAAVSASLEFVLPSVRNIAGLLASLRHPCPIPLFCQAADTSVFDLDELLASGLAYLDSGRRSVRMTASVSFFVARSFDSKTTSLQTEQFYLNTVAWFELNCGDASNREMIVEATQLAFTAILAMFQSGHYNEAIDLLVLIRSFLGGRAISQVHLNELRSWIFKSEAFMNLQWVTAALSVSAAYFHAGDFDSHAQLIDSIVTRIETENIATELQAEITLQLGLSWRTKGELGRSIEIYKNALFLARIGNAKGTTAKALFNLAMAYEAAGDVSSALEHLCDAQNYIDDQPDSSIVGLIELSIARLHFLRGSDPSFVRRSMENALTKALFMGNRRIAAEIIQNLGLLHHSQGRFVESIVHETIGTLILLESGFTNGFRMLTKSSLITLCASWLKLGDKSNAVAVRMMVDRMGTDVVYRPNQDIFESVRRLSVETVSFQSHAIATESEVVNLLNGSLKSVIGFVDQCVNRSELRFVIDLLNSDEANPIATLANPAPVKKGAMRG